MMYVTVYMSFNSNCRILAAELNYRFTANSLTEDRSEATDVGTVQAGALDNLSVFRFGVASTEFDWTKA